MTYNMFSGTLNPTQSINQSINQSTLLIKMPAMVTFCRGHRQTLCWLPGRRGASCCV